MAFKGVNITSVAGQSLLQDTDLIVITDSAGNLTHISAFDFFSQIMGKFPHKVVAQGEAFIGDIGAASAVGANVEIIDWTGTGDSKYKITLDAPLASADYNVYIQLRGDETQGGTRWYWNDGYCTVIEKTTTSFSVTAHNKDQAPQWLYIQYAIIM